MVKHGENFVLILANHHSPVAVKVELCVGIVPSIFRYNQTSMTVFHAAPETAVHISHIPVFNRCKEIFKLTISKTEKAQREKIETILPNAIENSFFLVGLDVSQRLTMELQ